MSNENKFKRLAEGYGFVEIQHSTPDGTFCTGCLSVHKRSTKMYANEPEGRETRQVMCREAVLWFYGSSD